MAQGNALTSLLSEIDTVAAEDTMAELTFSAYRDYFETGHRLRYERLYFRRRAQLIARVANALLVPETDLGPLSDTLWSVCNEPTWALPAHVAREHRERWDADRCIDLFAAETAHTLAETVAALRERLDLQLAGRVVAEVQRRVFEPFTDPRPMAWEGFGNNWEAVCGGAVGMAALALLGESKADTSRLGSILKRSRKAMDRFLAGFGSDGGCAEGVDYWVYGFGYFVYFAEALREHTGEDLMAVPKVREIAAFPHRAALGGGAFASFSDASPRPVLPAGLLTRLAERFGTPAAQVIPSFHDDHCYRWGHLSRTLAWFRAAPTPTSIVEPASFLPDLGWVIDRGRYSFAAKGGHNDEPHNHNDLGHFILHTQGESVLDDLGAGEYTADYFGGARYDSIYTSALGHSVPVIDGQAQLPGRDRTAKILRYAADAEGISFDLDLTTAYQVDGLLSFVRRFCWRRQGRLELTDEFDLGKPLAVEELFVSRRQPSLSSGMVDWGGLVTLTHSCSRASVDEFSTVDHHLRADRIYRVRCEIRAPAGRSVHRFVLKLR